MKQILISVARYSSLIVFAVALTAICLFLDIAETIESKIKGKPRLHLR